MLEDSYRAKGLRKKLIETLGKKGITDRKVLEVMNKLPRHWFIPDLNTALIAHAYEDKAFPIGEGQTISHPFTVAFQTQLLNIKKGEKILEIGTGSGYQTAILKEMGAKVFTIERQRDLFLKTSALFKKINLSVKTYFGDGYKGLPAFAPFDKIIVTCGAPFIPDTLVEQLKTGGMMIIPEGDGETQTMKKIVKNESGEVEIESFGEFSFVPMLEDKAH